MKQFIYNNQSYEIDDQNFLIDPNAWDENFTILPVVNQQSILDLCADLRENQEALVKDNFVTCWMHDMDEFVQETTKDAAEQLKLPLADESIF